MKRLIGYLLPIKEKHLYKTHHLLPHYFNHSSETLVDYLFTKIRNFLSSVILVFI